MIHTFSQEGLEFVPVLLVAFGEHEGLHTCSACGDDLLLDATDGQHLPGEGDLAGHGHVLSQRLAHTQREQGRHHA
jgi:hypothetical protein